MSSAASASAYIGTTDGSLNLIGSAREEFVNLTAKELNIKIIWKGKRKNEKCYWNDKPIIEIDTDYFRPTEVNSLRGDYSKARRKLGWKPKITVKQLIKEMIFSESNQ